MRSTGASLFVVPPSGGWLWARLWRTMAPHERGIPNKRATRAFSLVEVVLAIGIFSFAMVAILGLFGSSIGGVKKLADRDVLVAAGDAVAGKLAELKRTELAAVPAGSDPAVSGRPTFFAYAPEDLSASEADQDVPVFEWTNTVPPAAAVKGARVFRARVFRAFSDVVTEVPFAGTNISFPVRVVVDILAPGQNNETPAMTWSFHRVLVPTQ